MIIKYVNDNMIIEWSKGGELIEWVISYSEFRSVYRADKVEEIQLSNPDVDLKYKCTIKIDHSNVTIKIDYLEELIIDEIYNYYYKVLKNGDLKDFSSFIHRIN